MGADDRLLPNSGNDTDPLSSARTEELLRTLRNAAEDAQELKARIAEAESAEGSEPDGLAEQGATRTD